jgi:nucleoside phosphorylase
MRSELKPLRRKLGLRRHTHADHEWHVGTASSAELVASLANIGMAAATVATERLLDTFDVHHVVVVGIAGGIDPALEIGELVTPEVVIDWSTGQEYQPHQMSDVEPRGALLTADELLYQPDVLRGLIERGVVAVDMETASVAAVCESRGVPWSVFRAISDMAVDAAPLDAGIFAMVRPDGTADPAAAARYIATHPHRIPHLARLARGSQLAADTAADAASRALRA